MGGGSAPGPTQTTTNNVTPEQSQLINMMMPNLQQFAAKPLTLPNQPMTASFTPSQMQGQTMALNAAGTQAGTVGSAQEGSKFLTSGAALRPDSNPALQDWQQATIQPMEESYRENVIPAIREASTGVGQPGGSRGEIAEGIASRGLMRSEDAALANIANTGYGMGLGAMTKGLESAPNVAQSAVLPATTTSAVGDVQQGQNQAEINEMIQRYMFPQIAPYETASMLGGVLGGLPGGSTTTTASAPPDAPWWQQAAGYGSLAGGLLGKGGISSIGGMLGGGGAAAGGADMLAATGGAGLPTLASLSPETLMAMGLIL